MTGPSPQSTFTDEEFEEFTEEVVRNSWEAERPTDDPLHDIAIKNETRKREIRINTAKNRISYRDMERDHWGLQQKPITDIASAAEKLITVALQVPMSEVQYIGFGGHPDPPSGEKPAYDNYDEDSDTLTGY